MTYSIPPERIESEGRVPSSPKVFTLPTILQNAENRFAMAIIGNVGSHQHIDPFLNRSPTRQS